MTRESWLSADGKEPLLKNIYCRGTLDAAQPTSAASQAREAICDHSGTKYFSESGLDAFLASRFGGNYSYGTGLWRSAASQTPFSTEPNIPWMLADYVITYAANQSRADSWKKVQAEAQVDLLLCSDRKCKVLVDLQTVTITAENGTTTPPFRGIALSCLARSNALAVGAATASHLASAPTLLRRDELIPPFFQKQDSNSQPIIEEVQYNAVRNGFVWDHLSQGPRLKSYLDFKSSACYASYDCSDDPRETKNASAGWPLWHSMKFGHYRASKLEGMYLTRTSENCVTVLWPSNAWMEAHGWNVSDPECAAGSSSNTGNTGPLDHPVIWFDSYFPQHHILGGQVKVKYNVYYALDHTLLVLPPEIPEITETLVGQVVVPKSAKQWGRGSTHVQIAQETNISADGAMLRPAGQYGKSFHNWNVVVQSQQQVVCINESTSDLNVLCGAWVIGTASITALDEEFVMSSHPGQRDRLLYASSFYSKYASVNGSSLPWCGFFSRWGPPEPPVNIVVWVEGVSPADVPYAGISDINRLANDSSKSSFTALKEAYRQLYAADVLSNCSFWDERRIGYVHGADQQPKGPSAEWLTSTLQCWMNVSVNHTADTLSDIIWFPGFDDASNFIKRSELDHAAQQLVADATHLLHEQTNQELAITDMIRSVAGALMDISITIVAVVAMASGHSDMYAWTRGKVEWLSNHAFSQALLSVIGSNMAVTVIAKLLTVIIVVMGLVVSPAFILAGDIRAGRNNADGSSSQVGLLPRTVPNIMNESEPVVLIAAVTVRIMAEKNDRAQALLWLNLVLAVIAAFLVCVSVIRLPVGKKLRRRNAKARWTFQDQSSLPHIH
jgi:hypothetical protein